MLLKRQDPKENQPNPWGCLAPMNAEPSAEREQCPSKALDKRHVFRPFTAHCNSAPLATVPVLQDLQSSLPLPRLLAGANGSTKAEDIWTHCESHHVQKLQRDLPLRALFARAHGRIEAEFVGKYLSCGRPCPKGQRLVSRNVSRKHIVVAYPCDRYIGHHETRQTQTLKNLLPTHFLIEEYIIYCTSKIPKYCISCKNPKRLRNILKTPFLS